jgi:hypothetical protein
LAVFVEMVEVGSGWNGGRGLDAVNIWKAMGETVFRKKVS